MKHQFYTDGYQLCITVRNRGNCVIIQWITGKRANARFNREEIDKEIFGTNFHKPDPEERAKLMADHRDYLTRQKVIYMNTNAGGASGKEKDLQKGRVGGGNEVELSKKE